MNKNEALKAAIDGKKIRPLDGCRVEYICFDRQSNRFLLKWTGESAVDTFNGDGWNISDWEIVSEYVDFATAWKAYEVGKIIKGESGKEYQRNEHEHHWRFSTDDIRGKWIILEDE